MKTKTLYGRVRGKNGEIYMFTKVSNSLFTIVKVLIMLIALPVWLIPYCLIYLGCWSESFLDWIDPKIERLLARIIPRDIGN